MTEFAGCVCLFVRLRTLDKEYVTIHHRRSSLAGWQADHRCTNTAVHKGGGWVRQKTVGRIPIVFPPRFPRLQRGVGVQEMPPPYSVCPRSKIKILDNPTSISMVGGMLLQEGGFIDDGRGRRTRPSMRARQNVLAYIIQIRHRRPRGRAILCSAIS
ncbi:hypothetical protein BDP81DRAFT_144891 [Colletotrichum phormii]|uniref:Uncharacterized protein n=1 Tax=Colletotrichum phormii TaxID=359342 RepID=A0AAI9ZDM9_9PEZI|nr:uncharacterized protein BDP81DRAFT_144891 [Colletotrichum phormii]KAK1622617.1 hypothetical protein BDP81DRAFT_144891 [Colletotrichum phormii]